MIEKNRIRNIAQSIADSSYEGHYTIEKYSETEYKFGFGIYKPDNIPKMFSGSSIEEAMYLAIDAELVKEANDIDGCEITSYEELIGLIQENQQKHKESELKCEKLLLEIDGFKQERAHVDSVIDRFVQRWKDNTIMKMFEEKLDVWKEKNLSLFVAFLLEQVERQNSHLEILSSDITHVKKFGEKKELIGTKTLATFHTGKVFESIWNEIQDVVMDGNWHSYTEAEDIIMEYMDYELTTNAVRQRRQSYFYFAKDEKYHDLRGGKDYTFEWKRNVNGNKFRFISADGNDIFKEAGVCIDTINKHVICKTVRDEFVRLFCDNGYHSYSEAIDMFKKYDKYKKYKKRESFYPLVRAYTKHIAKFYQVTKCRENNINKFKFDSKDSKL